MSLSLAGNSGQVDILHDIDITIHAKESVGLIGRSGSGKSSLLMVLGGLEQATRGHVTILGNQLGSLSEDQLSRFRLDHIGIVFQNFHLIPTMTALENVMVPLELAGKPDAAMLAKDALALVGLADRMGHYPSQLSGGEQQRVALARATVTRPDILLADEPTGNLDGPTGDAIVDLLFDLRDQHGSTLVLVTHSQSLADRCDRTIRLKDGRIESTHTSKSAA